METVLDGNILGKPKDKTHAFSMLKAYSNRTHQVLTSVCLKREDVEKVRQNTTLVSFSELTDEAIEAYLSQGDYQDKAGAYGIQSAIASYIKRLEGCFYSVMGLPLYDVRCVLER